MSDPDEPLDTPAPRGLARPLIGPFTGRHIVGLVSTLVVVAIVLSVFTAPIAAPGSSAGPTPGTSFFPIGDPKVGLSIGQVAPEFTGTVDGLPYQLTDLDGNPIRLADLRGHPVWIDFWATWCPPCQGELPIIRKVYETHQAQGLEIVAISVQESSPEDVRAYAATYGLGYTIGFDGSSAIFDTYQVSGLPTQYFLDRDGIIREIVLGPLTELRAEQILAPLLTTP